MLNIRTPLATFAAGALLTLLSTGSALASTLTLPKPKAGHARRLVVIVAENRGAEVTDFIAPYAVLKESGVFEVRAVSTEAGPVQLRRALRIAADQTLQAFDASAPEGADIVVVPAQAKADDPILTAWIKAQAAKGAVIVSICEGARSVAAAGLFDGKRAATHWLAIASLKKKVPTATWVRDQRYVQDGAVISTTGVTASMPVSIALVEAAGGPGAAQQTAARLGIADWSSRHRTAAFNLSVGDYLRAIGSLLAVWRHETAQLPVSDGQDELALALRADVWTRSFRAKVITTAAGAAPVRSHRGLVILPDAAPSALGYQLPTSKLAPGLQMDAALDEMGRRYGPFSVHMAKMGMEYAGSAGRP